MKEFNENIDLLTLDSFEKVISHFSYKYYLKNLINWNQLIKKLSNTAGLSADFSRINKCPDSCLLSSLLVWKSLFACFIGLTLATICFVASYSVFSKFQYQKYNKIQLSKSLAIQS